MSWDKEGWGGIMLWDNETARAVTGKSFEPVRGRREKLLPPPSLTPPPRKALPDPIFLRHLKN